MGTRGPEVSTSASIGTYGEAWSAKNISGTARSALKFPTKAWAYWGTRTARGTKAWSTSASSSAHGTAEAWPARRPSKSTTASPFSQTSRHPAASQTDRSCETSRAFMMLLPDGVAMYPCSAMHYAKPFWYQETYSHQASQDKVCGPRIN